MIYLNGHKFWVLIAFLLALSPEINAQSGGSLSLNEKSGADISAFFSNFIGIPFAEEEIDFLTAQVGRLDSVDALASVVAGYSLLEPKTFERLLAPPPEVSTYFTVGFLPRKDGSIKFDFFVNTAYATYTESENQALSAAVSASIIDYYNASSYFYSSIPDAIGVGAEVYLAYVNGYLEDMPFIEDGQTLLTAAAATENPALKSLVDDQGATHDVERNPYVFVEEERTFMSMSGIPLILPARTFVRFYQLGHRYQSCVHSFTIEDERGIVRTYGPLEFIPGHNYAGFFSGYGYLPVKQHSQATQKPHVKYSYKSLVKDPPVVDYPSYRHNDPIGVTYGIIYPCRENRVSSSYYTTSLPFQVANTDLSDPTTNPNHDLSQNTFKQYLSINLKTPGADLWASNKIPVVNWDIFQDQAVWVNQTADKAKKYPCIIDSLMEITNVNLALQAGLGYVTKLADGSVASVMTFGNYQYFAYFPFVDSDEVRYMVYHPSGGWMDIETVAYNPSEAIFQVFRDIGIMVATGAFVYVSVAVGAAGGALAIAIVGKASIYAAIAAAVGAGIFDIGLAGAEASFVYYINEDEDAYWRTLKTGIIFAGIGTAGELVLETGIRAFYASKYGESLANTGHLLPGFNMAAKIKQGDAFIDVDLNQFTKNLEVKHRLNPLQVKFFLKDLKENGRFARAVLLNGNYSGFANC
jgi:hypothetical protein